MKTTFRSDTEADFKKRIARISQYTSRVETEVYTADMESTQKKLDSMNTFFQAQITGSGLDAPMPKIHLVPHSQNHKFFGRQDLLDQIRYTFAQKSTSAQRRYVLCGLGGSGKTQIATEFSYKYLDDFQAVIWILADSLDKIQQGFGEVSELLGMDRSKANAASAKNFVLQRLASCGTLIHHVTSFVLTHYKDKDYLLVFDNADDVGLIMDCFPVSHHCSILVTTRDAVSTDRISPHKAHVSAFSVEEGAEFLESLIPEAGKGAGNDRLRKEAFLRISKIFHGYPLALSQAAGFIGSGGATLFNFESLLQDQRNSAAIADLPVDYYHDPLATAWDLYLGSLNPNCKLILDILAFLDPDSIPYELFKEGSRNRHSGDTRTQLEFLSNDIQFWEALLGLRSKSLVRANKDLETISIHRFSQEQVFNQLRNNQNRRRLAFEHALYLLTNAHPEFLNHSQHWAPDNWKSSEKYLPHVKKLETMFLEGSDTYQGSELKLARVMYHCAT